MNDTDLTWDNITSFTPGIVQRTFGDPSGTGTPPTPFALGQKGSANTNGTFGCYAVPSGALYPLPAQDYTFNIAFNPGYVCPIVFQSGMTVMPQVGSGAVLPDVGALPANPNVGVYAGYMFANPVGTVVQHKIFRWALNHGNNSTTANVTNFIHQANGNPFTSSGLYATALEAILTPATAPTRDVTWYSEDATGAAVLNASDSGLIGATVNGELVLLHQQRIVSLTNLAGQFVVSSAGGNTDAWALLNEQINFTQVVNYTPAGPSYLGTEIPYGYGVVASQSASDLLMVKHSGGGLLVQGDLSSPIVRRMPEVASTFGATMYGAATPTGFVYGQNHGGVYSWSGGDTSQLLSNQLQDGFWMPPAWIANGTAYTISPYRGKFCYWKDWVLCPNGWLYDTLTGGWWQMQQPSLNSCAEFAVDPQTNRLFGAIPYSTVTNNTLVPMILGWNPTTPGTTYTWTSNPLWMLADTPYVYGECREIVLEVFGVGTIQVSFATDQTTGGPPFVNPVSVSLTATDSTASAPSRVRINVPQTPVPIRGTWVAFQIQANGQGQPAPQVHGLYWGARRVSSLRAF